MNYLEDIAKLSCNINLKELPSILAKKGIILVCQEQFKSMKTNGVVFKLPNKNFYVIGLTAMRNRLDIFWFNLLHELAHLLYDKDSIDTGEGIFDDFTTDDSKVEKKADETAAKAFDKDGKIKNLFHIRGKYISNKQIDKLAIDLQIDKSIIAGQLSRLYPNSENSNRRFSKLFGTIKDKLDF